MVFGCISKNFPENIFWCLEKKKENTNQKMQIRKHKPQIQERRSTIAPRDLVDRAALFSLSLSLSLSLRKLIEVKMRGENDFRVNGENIGQPEVIFRKMIFSVTAKHAEKGENDFLKSFSPKTNAPLTFEGSLTDTTPILF